MHLRARINQAFQNLAHSRRPFSIVLRWIVIVGIALSGVSSDNLWKNNNIRSWLIALIFYLIYTFVISVLLIRNPTIQKQPWSFLVQLAVDTAFCSWFLYLSGTVDTDLYLNYFLPLLLILENVVEGAGALFYCLLVYGAYFIVLTLITIYYNNENSYLHMIVRGYLPRVTIFTFLMIFAITRNIRLSEKR